MNASGDTPRDDAIAATAARWTVRRDRGLSAAESIEYELWLAADPRHRAAMARTGDVWGRLDRLPENLAQHILEESRHRRRCRRRHRGWWRWRTAPRYGSTRGAKSSNASPSRNVAWS